jgi:hypothetical protein
MLSVVLILTVHALCRYRFTCSTYWASQFYAMREVVCGFDGARDHQKAYVRSLSLASHWDIGEGGGGKSGATFSKTRDERYTLYTVHYTIHYTPYSYTIHHTPYTIHHTLRKVHREAH